MNRMEKVKRGLEHCTQHDDGQDKFGGVGKCNGCPYYGYDCTGEMKMDALTLLKEREQHCCCLCGNYDTVDNYCNYHKHDVDVSEYCSRWIPR